MDTDRLWDLVKVIPGGQLGVQGVRYWMYNETKQLRKQHLS